MMRPTIGLLVSALLPPSGQTAVGRVAFRVASSITLANAVRPAEGFARVQCLLAGIALQFTFSDEMSSGSLPPDMIQQIESAAVKVRDCWPLGSSALFPIAPGQLTASSSSSHPANMPCLWQHPCLWDWLRAVAQASRDHSASRLTVGIPAFHRIVPAGCSYLRMSELPPATALSVP